MKLFISYAHSERRKVDRIVELLRTGGHDPWFDHALMPGQDWKEELREAIAACEAFVYVMSPDALASEWCQWEFQQAVQLGKPVVPVLLKAATIPAALSRYQYADLSGGITADAVARFMGGLTDIAVTVPADDVPDAPADPSGIPPQAVRQTSPYPTYLVTIFALIGVALIAFVMLSGRDDSTPPLSAEAYLQRGNTAYGQGDFQAAIDDYASAIDANPDYRQAHHNLGLTYEQLGDHEQAIAAYTDAITIDDGYASAYYNRAVSYERSDQYEDAINDYTMTLNTFDRSRDDLDLELLALLGRSSAARKAAEDGQEAYYAQALEDADAAIEINPNFARAYAIRGDVYYSQESYDLALADYVRHTELADDDPAITPEPHILTRIPQLEARLSD